MSCYTHIWIADLKKSGKVLLSVAGVIFRVLDFIWPKQSNVIIFGSNQGNFISGSPKYLYEYVKKHHPEYQIHYYLPLQQKGILKRISYILHFTPVFFRSKFLISSHSPYDFIPFSWSKRKIHINTWHGVPLKCMFFCDRGATKSDINEVIRSNDLTTIFLISSSLEAAFISRCFLIDPRKFAFFGHPRNDMLTSASESHKISVIIPSLPEYNKLILYCPTYRRNEPSHFFPFDDINFNDLHRYLEEHKIIIFTRGHVQDVGNHNWIHGSRIIELGQNLVSEVNDILPEIDILITDYSSIFIDYLLLNRPCIFVPYDRERYEREVGFLIDDYDYWTPGQKVYTYSAFIEALDAAVTGKDSFSRKREEIKNLFHFFQTGSASERLVRYMKQFSDI